MTSTVTALTGAGSYGIDNMYADDNGKLYLWLPEGTTVTKVQTDNGTYNGSVRTNANGQGDATAVFSLAEKQDGTNHLSVYGVGYTAPSEKFDDTKNHWAKDFIDYVAGRGLLTGSTKNKFSPNEKMTRGMLVTALGRLAGVNSKDYDTNSFSDVQNDSSYRPYIEWAYSKGVIYGIGDGTFAPDKSITREEMAVIFERYAKATGYKIPVSREASIYEDKENIGSEYKEAVTAMQQSGIMMGIEGDKFNPKGTATRAEVSAMLSRYIKLTITPETAQGFAIDDAGKYHCYKDGKAMTGKQTINGMVYFFDESGVLQTGWVKDGNRWRYYDGAKAHKGWLHLKTDGEEKNLLSE